MVAVVIYDGDYYADAENNEGDIFVVDDVAVVFDINDAGCCDDICDCNCNCDDNDNVETAVSYGTL